MCEQFSDPEERLSGSEKEEDEDDVEAALKKEVDQIRTSTEQKLRRFQSVESGANNVVFIRTRGIGGAQTLHGAALNSIGYRPQCGCPGARVCQTNRESLLPFSLPIEFCHKQNC